MKHAERLYTQTKQRLAQEPIARALSFNGVSPSQLLQPVARVLSNRVTPELLQPGDHVYSWRHNFFYAHHGIYVGKGKVIHFTRTEGQELTGTVLDKVASINGSVPCHVAVPCKECGLEQNAVRNGGESGVVRTCMKCFLQGGQLYRYDYGKNTIKFLLNVRGGTCTLALSDSKEEVLHRAEYLWKHGFQCYNLFNSNCEDFAVYCKTGLFVMRGIKVVGASGQAATVVGAPFAVVTSFPLYVAGPLGVAALTVGIYCLSRYLADVKHRPGTSKIAVEDLVKASLLPPPPVAPQTS